MNSLILTYLHGRKVKDVLPVEKAGETWTIVFDGGARIHNFDAAVRKPEVVGKGLRAVVYGGGTTTLDFGEVQVALTASEYAITDEHLTGGAMFFPERDAEPQAQLPEDPSPQRVAEGPDEDGS